MFCYFISVPLVSSVVKRDLLFFLKPVEGHKGEVFEIDDAVAVYVAGDGRFAGWFAKV
jgi:hypothetical protein